MASIKCNPEVVKGKMFCNNCQKWVKEADADKHAKICWKPQPVPQEQVETCPCGEFQPCEVAPQVDDSMNTILLDECEQAVIACDNVARAKLDEILAILKDKELEAKAKAKS